MKKKLIAIILGLIMVFAFAACGNEDAPASDNKGASATPAAPAEKVDEFGAEKYGLNLTSEDIQPMSEERATSEILAETAKDWLGGSTLFTYSSDSEKKTYAEFVEHIGCEPSQYKYDAKNNHRIFIWIAEEDDTANFHALFEESEGEWTLHSVGGSNLGLA